MQPWLQTECRLFMYYLPEVQDIPVFQSPPHFGLGYLQLE